MPRDGGGNFTLVAGNPVVSGTTISSTVHNNTNDDIADALTASLAKDGQTVPTANLPMGSFRHTGVGDASLRNQYAVVNQVQDGDYNLVGSVAGTNTVTGNLAPAISSYSAGMRVTLIPANANTGATTLNLNGLGALDIQKWVSGAQANIVANDLRAGIPAYLVLDTAGDDWILLNPNSGNLGDVTVGTLTATNVATTNINGVTAPAAANPTASVGLSAVNGTATTFMRSDGAPALSQSIAPTMTGIWTFTNVSSNTGAVIVENASPIYGWNETDAGVNEKRWRAAATGGVWFLGTVTDADTAGSPAIAVDRGGTTIDSIALTSTALTWNASAMVNVASAPTWTGHHTFTNNWTSGNPGAVTVSAAVPYLELDESDAAADNRRWTFNLRGTEQFLFQLANDARTSFGTIFSVDRTGTTVDRVRFPSEASGALVIGNTGNFYNSPILHVRTSGASSAGATIMNAQDTIPTLQVHNEDTAGDNIFVLWRTEADAGTTRAIVDFNRAGLAVRYNTTCDGTLKTNIVDSGSALEIVMSLQVRAFDWIENGYHVPHGFIAQEAHKVCPDAVSVGDEKRPWQMDFSKIVPALTKALQETISRCDLLEKRLMSLESAD